MFWRQTKHREWAWLVMKAWLVILLIILIEGVVVYNNQKVQMTNNCSVLLLVVY